MARCRIAVLMMFVLWCGMAAAQDSDVLLTPYQDVSTQDLEQDPANSPDMGMAGTNGSSGYTATLSTALADNHFNCWATYARNCWTQTTSGVVSQISSGVDGYTLAVNSGHVTYNLPLATSSDTQANWVTMSGISGVDSIAVADRYAVYGLGTGTCGGASVVKKANSGLTGFTVIPGCLSQLSAAPGVIGGVNLSNGTSYFSYNDGTTWYTIPGAFKKVVVTSSATAIGLGTDTIVYTITLSASGATFASAGIGSGYTDIAGGTSAIWALKGSTPYYKDISTSGTVVHQMAGAVNGIAGREPFIFGFVGTQPYHFVSIGINVKMTTAGSYATYCANQPNGCPIGSAHTVTSSVAWSQGGISGSSGKVSTASGTPQTVFNVGASDTNFVCDILFGVPSGAPYCREQSSGLANCSKMGQLLASATTTVLGWWHKHVMFANVLAKYTGGPGTNCIGVGVTSQCYWPTVPNCSNGTPTPFNPPAVLDKNPLPPLRPINWMVLAECISFGSGYPWHCLSVDEKTRIDGAPIGPMPCTNVGLTTP